MGGNGGDGGYGGAAFTAGNGRPGGDVYAGGLVGYGKGDISNSYASKSINFTVGKGGKGGSAGSPGKGGSGGDGGICSSGNSCNGNRGRNGYVGSSGFGYAGGIFGSYSSGTNAYVYYNSDEASQLNTDSPIGITALTDADMKKKASFDNWDFNNIWGIVEEYIYPFLRYFLPSYIPLAQIEAEYIDDQIYTGSEIKPVPKIKLKGGASLLSEGIHYELSYQNNKNAGTGKIILTGIDEHSELSETILFNIVPKTLTITGATADKVYDGTTTATITGATLVGVIDGDEVSLSSDFATGTFASANAGKNIAISMDMSLAGADASNYVLQPLTANIEPKELAEDAIQPIAQQTYTGLVPDIIAMDGSKTLEKDTDYTITCSTNVGTATLTIIGIGNYTGSATADFTIVAKEITTGMLSTIPPQFYTGSAIEPVVMKDGTILLIANTDYDVEYEDNVEVGTAFVTVTGKGNYTGEINTTFEIAKWTLKSGTFTDARDSKTYNFVKIGEQVWMAKNLNYNATGSQCYDNSDANCSKYGRLYNWATAINVCPTGWHLPTQAEWDALINSVGSSTAGKNLKATSGWDDNGNGTNAYGFAALPGGHSLSSLSSLFRNVGTTGYWWTASQYRDDSTSASAYDRYINYDNDRVYGLLVTAKSYFQSVRCLMNVIAEPDPSSSSAASSSSKPSSSSSKLSSSSSKPSSSSNKSTTRCKNYQNREFYCQWETGCYAIDPEFETPKGQTCDALVDHCLRDGVLFVESSVEGSGTKCTTPSSSSDSSTPILLSQTSTANSILATHNAITLHVQSTAKLEIYNLNGKLQKTLNLSNGIYNIPLGNLPKGIYIANAKFSNRENPKIEGIGVQTKVVVK